MWGDESEAVAPIIWLYQIVDAQKEEVFFPELLITLRSYDKSPQLTKLQLPHSRSRLRGHKHGGLSNRRTWEMCRKDREESPK